MSEFAGPAIVLAAVVAALLIYILAWRMTRGGSLGLRALVRGGLPLLLVGSVMALAVLGTGLEPALEKIDGRLSGTPPEQPLPDLAQEQAGGESAEADRQGAQFEAARRARRLESREDERVGATAPAARGLNPNDMPDAALPGAGNLTPPLPPAAVNGHDEGPLTIQPPAGAPASEAEARRSLPTGPVDGLADDSAAAPPAAERSVAAAKKASPEAPEESEWDVVPVFYGTDRAETPNAERLAYGSDRGRRLELGRALVTVPKSHQVPQIERPWALRIPYFDVTIYEEAEDPEKHFTLQEIKSLPKDAFLALVRERLAASQRFKDHAIVFVHGYNTAFDNAVYRTAQIAYDLDFDGAPFLYSWPSGGGVASYTYDRESAEAAVPYLRQFMEMVVKETGAKSISVIAHSMGNQPLLEVLKDMKSQTPEGVVIDQVISAAPDVDADNFTNLARRIEGFAKGVTLYAAANDRALIISRSFWQNPRAGDVPPAGPLIVPGVDTIDVTGISTDAFALNHSGYAENTDLLEDIGKLILSGLRPPDQRLPKLVRVPSDKGDYWRYVQAP